MNSSTSSTVYVRKGKTTSKSVRSCDTVRAGAFFPQAQLQVPQKEMCQHCHQHMLRCGKVDRGSLECLKPTRPCPMLSSSIEEVGDGEHQVVGTSWGGSSSGHRVGRTRPYGDGQ